MEKGCKYEYCLSSFCILARIAPHCWLRRNRGRKQTPPFSAEFIFCSSHHAQAQSQWATISVPAEGLQWHWLAPIAQASRMIIPRKESLSLLPKGVDGHMVVALGRQPLTTEYVPEGIFWAISANYGGRLPYPFQLHLRNHNDFLGPRSALPLHSYLCLRAEEYLHTLEMLVRLEGDFGEHIL